MALRAKVAVYLIFVAATAVALCACNQQRKNISVNGPFAEYPFPKPVGYVNDFVHVFSSEETNTLNTIIALNEKATTNEIAIVTINDSTVNRNNLADYVTALFNNWGIGKKGKNNGVILCIFPSIHMLRIGTGKGIEEKLTNAEVGKIIDSIIVPEYKAGDYYMGTKNGLLAIADKIK